MSLTSDYHARFFLFRSSRSITLTSDPLDLDYLFRTSLHISDRRKTQGTIGLKRLPEKDDYYFCAERTAFITL